MTRGRALSRPVGGGRDLDRVGDLARAAGLVALAATLVPVVGEIVAVPVAAAAIVLGMVGVRRYETGRATTAAPALLGAFLGMAAVLVVTVTFVVTRAP